MTSKTFAKRLVYGVVVLLILAVLFFLAVTPDKCLNTKPVYGAF